MRCGCLHGCRLQWCRSRNLSMRAFVALMMPDALQDALERLQAELPTGRSVAPENLHVTLAFLDDRPEAQLRVLHDYLSDLSLPPVELKIQGLSVFGGKSPRVLVADVAASPQLTSLHRRIRSCAHEAEIELPRVRFRPHVTLQRFARRLDAGEIQRIGEVLQTHGGFSLPGVTIDRLGLYQSILLPDGPRYEVLADYPLEGAP